MVTLAKLCLKEDLVLWDVGAGTGTIAVEAARLLQAGMVFAVEKDEEAFQLLEENARAFRVTNLIPIRGEAPEVLHRLPDPDRVFVGGSGGQLQGILEIVSSRLRGDGVVVVNAITLETVSRSVAFLEEIGFTCAMVFLGVSWGERVGDKHLLRAANPVYIIQGRKR